MTLSHSHCFKHDDLFRSNDNEKTTLNNFIKQATAFLPTLKAQASMDDVAYLASPHQDDYLAELKAKGDFINKAFKNVVVMGTGGSSLGAQALINLKKSMLDAVANPINIDFPDNLSPHSMEQIVSRLKSDETHFIVISKSGGTAETLSQFLIALKQYDSTTDLTKHFTIITEPGTGALRTMAEAKGLPILDHPKNLGGRYSVMSVVGLLPAYIAGLDIDKVLDGARAYVDALFDGKDNKDNHPVIQGAVMAHYLQSHHHKNISFLMPYDHHLHFFGQWYQQLWAESLGKEGMGQTPVRALGPLDQHSQLQLLIDGPNDKYITILTEDCRGIGPLIANEGELDDGLAYLNGRTVGDVVYAEAEATLKVLKDKGLAVRHIHYPRLDESILGELLMHFMLETSVTAHLMGVDAYDQPAVESGKILTRDYLSKM